MCHRCGRPRRGGALESQRTQGRERQVALQAHRWQWNELESWRQGPRRRPQSCDEGLLIRGTRTGQIKKLRYEDRRQCKATVEDSMHALHRESLGGQHASMITGNGGQGEYVDSISMLSKPLSLSLSLSLPLSCSLSLSFFLSLSPPCSPLSSLLSLWPNISACL